LVCDGVYIGESSSHVDHRKPIWLWNLDDPEQLRKCKSIENAQRLCEPCHKHKTGDEAGVRAKCDRIRAKHTGQPQKKRKPFPGGKGDRYKRLMNGRTVRRDEGDTENE
jgi:5-methylcytosine-specific restriction endonuclease McrA